MTASMLRRTEPVVSLVPRFDAPCPVEARRRSDVVDAPLRQKVCRRCNRLFAICASCDRGHAYCSPACRTAARRASVRAARQRHRRSPEGRLDHRDHQRAYRARVRDQTSPRAVAARHTAGGHDDGSGADRAPGGRVALHGLWPGKRLAPSTALADPSRVPGDAP